MAYCEELRDAMVAKILLLNNQSITRISKLEGILEVTLRKWRDGVRTYGQASTSLMPVQIKRARKIWNSECSLQIHARGPRRTFIFS